ncbi:MAG: penicillin-binding transpeptidase domain-containing protein [Sporomusaceae bacterium]|nr:penicillin-binding transpeptidase domain-containing protein [Sporomusaceae bacterium]
MRLGVQPVYKRIALVLTLIMAALALLALRIAWIQFVDGKAMAEKMQAQLKDTRLLYSPRGVIYDRNGRELAISAMRKSLYADPGEIPAQRREETARLLAPILAMRTADLLELLATDSRFVWIRRTLEPEISDQIKAAIASDRLTGLHFVEESKRYYPNGMLAAHVLGFVGTDDIGLEGLELSYDRLIRSETVKRLVDTDSQGVPIFQSVFRSDEVSPMTNLYLTLDASMQFIVEKALDKVMTEKKAKSATAIIMDPRSGEILAMASRPGYDPNRFGRYAPEVWQNRAVSFVYEPGSTFKAVVTAAALQEGLVRPDELFTDSGKISIGGITVQNWDGEGRGVIPFRDVVKDSLNTGFVMIGERLGAERLMQYTRQFGFGRATDLQLPGEEGGLLFDAKAMRLSDVASVSIGQSIAVTPVQLLTAIAAIANDGVLLRPYIVKELRRQDGTTLSHGTTEPVRQVISPAAARDLTAMMELVVSTGGGKQAAVSGYRFAGKTGTAEKLKSNGSGYERGSYIASFAGFGPVEEPQLAALIVIDDPDGMYYGGQVAAPVFKEIMTQIMLYRSLQQNTAAAPPPQPQRDLEPGMDNALDRQGQTTVPDVRGKTVREAARLLAEANLAFSPVGSGLAVSQEPPPKANVSAGAAVRVTFTQ